MPERNQWHFGKLGVAACFGDIAQKTVESVLHTLIDVPLLSEARSYPKQGHTGRAHTLAECRHREERFLIHILKGEHQGFDTLSAGCYPEKAFVWLSVLRRHDAGSLCHIVIRGVLSGSCQCEPRKQGK